MTWSPTSDVAAEGAPRRGRFFANPFPLPFHDQISECCQHLSLLLSPLVSVDTGRKLQYLGWGEGPVYAELPEIDTLELMSHSLID